MSLYSILLSFLTNNECVVLPGSARHEAQLSLEAFGNVLANTGCDKMCD